MEKYLMRWITVVKTSLLFLLACFIGYLLLHFREGERDELPPSILPPAEEEVIRSSEKFDLHHTRLGQPEYQLSAEQVTGYEGGMTVLETVEMRYFENGTFRCVVTAREAYYSSVDGNVRLVGEIVGSDESGLTLFGEEFLYVSEDQAIVSTHSVRFEYGTWRGNGSSLRYAVPERLLYLKDPVLEGEREERLQALESQFQFDDNVAIFEGKVSGSTPHHAVRSKWLRIRLDDDEEVIRELQARGEVHIRSQDKEGQKSMSFLGDAAAALFDPTNDSIEEIHLTGGRVRREDLTIEANQIDLLGSIFGVAQGSVKAKRVEGKGDPFKVQAKQLQVSGSTFLFQGEVMSEVRPTSGRESRAASHLSGVTSHGSRVRGDEQPIQRLGTWDDASTQASAPIYVVADELFIDEERQIAVYAGEVLATQGRNSITASRLTVWGREEKVLAEGEVAVQLWEGEQAVEIDALQMTYHRHMDRVVFLSDVAFQKNSLQAKAVRAELEMAGTALQQAAFYGDVALTDPLHEARGEEGHYDVGEGQITVQSSEGVSVLIEKATGRRILGKSFLLNLEEDLLQVEGDPYGRIEVKNGRSDGGT